MRVMCQAAREGKCPSSTCDHRVPHIHKGATCDSGMCTKVEYSVPCTDIRLVRLTAIEGERRRKTASKTILYAFLVGFGVGIMVAVWFDCGKHIPAPAKVRPAPAIYGNGEGAGPFDSGDPARQREV